MMRFGIYSKHDFRFPLYDEIGNRYEGCRGCGRTQSEIATGKDPRCIRPMAPLEGELVELLQEGELQEGEPMVTVMIPRSWVKG